MSTSQRTFNQVKSILGKLDQRIDSLRSQRTNDRLIGQAVPATPVSTPSVPSPTMSMPTPPAPAAPAPPRSPFGRATPIRPTN